MRRQTESIADVPWTWVQVWTRWASCTQTGVNWHPEELAEQKALTRTCQGCPVRKKCLTWALENGEHTGVWGGLTERELRRSAALTPQGIRHVRPGVKIPCPWCRSKAVEAVGTQRLGCNTCGFSWPGVIDEDAYADAG